MMVVDLPLSYFTSTLAGALTGRPGTSFLVDGGGAILGPPGCGESLAERWQGARRAQGRSSGLVRASPQVVDLAGRRARAARPRRSSVRTAGRSACWRRWLRSRRRCGRSPSPRWSMAAPERSSSCSRSSWSRGARAGGCAGCRRRPPSWRRATSGCACRRRAPTRSPTSGARSTSWRSPWLAGTPELGARTEEAQRRRQELEVLNTVIQAAHTSLDLRESLEAILDRLMALFDFMAGAIRLLDEPRDNLILVAHRGLRPSYAANPDSLAHGRGPQRAGAPNAAALAPERADRPRSVRGPGARGHGGGRRSLDPDPVEGPGLGAVVLMGQRKPEFTESRALAARQHRPGGWDRDAERAPLQPGASAAGGGGAAPGARGGAGGDRAVSDGDARPRPRPGSRGRARVRGDECRCREHPAAGRRHPSLRARSRTVRRIARRPSS